MNSQLLILVFTVQEKPEYTENPPAPILYQVALGLGYLELPQGFLAVLFWSFYLFSSQLFIDLIFMFFLVDTPGEKLTTKMLETKNVYILDCHSEIFVWYVKILSKIRSLGFSFFREIFFCSIEQLEKRYEKLQICSVFLVKKRF